MKGFAHQSSQIGSRFSRRFSYAIKLPFRKGVLKSSPNTYTTGAELRYDWAGLYKRFGQMNLFPYKQFLVHETRCPSTLGIHKALKRFEYRLIQFWNRRLSNALDTALELRFDLRVLARQSGEKSMEFRNRLVKWVAVLVSSQKNYGRQMWSDFYRRALQELVALLGSLQCPPCGCVLSGFHSMSPEIGTSQIIGTFFHMNIISILCNEDLRVVDPRKVDAWANQMTILLDSEFSKLDKALKDQV